MTDEVRKEKRLRDVFNNNAERGRRWVEEWEKTRLEILELLKGRKEL